MSGKKICKICGKEYEACHSMIVAGYHWQDVACCPEHGAEYLSEILKSRGEAADTAGGRDENAETEDEAGDTVGVAVSGDV